MTLTGMTPATLQRIFSRAYDAVMYPLELTRLRQIRSNLIGRARGDVLEIGAGSGVNVQFYHPEKLTNLTLTDSQDRTVVYRERMRRYHGTPPRIPFFAERIDAQRLPFADNSFDTVVATLVFCSVPCAPCGFSEIVRVLRPQGRYLFLEHVRPPGRVAARVTDRLNPVWTRLAGGCNLNRDTVQAMRDEGLEVSLAGGSVFVWGEARIRI